MKSTDRLYFADPYLTTFRARVVARADRKEGLAVALDRSAFYPEGGGQPADRGTIAGVAVLDVQADNDTVWHLVAAPVAADEIEAVVDWPRRLDHMQQHHGQHLLSAAFERLFGLRTESFHLGAAAATIDLNGTVSPQQAAAAEDLTNQVIWEDRPVQARFVTPEELARLPLRKPPVVDGAIRVVSVPEFDHSACGGTHPRSTGPVGLLHIRRLERRGGGSRVEFVCGGRALRDLRKGTTLLAAVSSTLTVGADELEAAVARLKENEQALHRRLENAMERLAGYEAAELVAQGAVVRRVLADRSLDEVRILAQKIASAGGVAILGLAGERAQLVFASPVGSPVNCGQLIRDVVSRLGGKGGGQPGLAQGGVPAEALEAALDAAAKSVSGAGGP